MRRSRVWGTALVVLGAGIGLMCATLPAMPSGAQTALEAKPSTGKLTPLLAELAQPSVQVLSPADQAQVVDVPVSGAGSLMERDGRVLVDVRVSEADPVTVNAIAAAGATVTFVSARYALVTAEIAPSDLDALAALPAVLSVQEVLEPNLGGAGIPASEGDVEAQAGTCPSGADVSEADTQLRAALARFAFDLDGSGVKIGVLSDSYDTSATAITHAAGDVAAGDLPGIGNPCGHVTPVTVLSDTAGTDEGRAMLQAIHDVVPGAQLAFSTAFGGETVMAQHIHDLQAWGADIIVDDVAYFAEPFYQDGVIAVAINEVTALGVSYFSSAGNSNLIEGGQHVGSYEAPAFRPTTCPPTVGLSYSCHDFDAAGGIDNGWNFTIANGGRIRIDFQFAEPRNGVTDDFDVVLLNAATNQVLALSTQDNELTQVPWEMLQVSPWSGPTTNVKLVIARWNASGTAAPPVKFISIGSAGVSGVEYNASSNGDVVGPTIFGHNGAKNAGSTAAVPYDDSTRAETFTSHGPVTLRFGPVVGVIPAAPLGAPDVVAKPDFAATDGARNSFFGSNVAGVKRFYGTSQAAPHAAAVAALLLQLKPSLTPSEIRDILGAYADSIPGASQDTVGAGLIDAFLSVQGVGLPKVKSFSPAAGPVGTELVIKGYNLNELEGISFNGTPASIFDDVPNPNVATATVPVGATTGKITATTNDGVSVSVGDFTVGVAVGGRFTGITPVRALDTRNTGPCVGTTPRNLTLGGQFGVPVNATAVALNVTVVSPSGAGFLTAWPTGQMQPLASNLNFLPGQTVPNMVTVKLGAGAAISMFANNGCPHVVVDVAGYYTGPGAAGPGGFTGITPVRVLDTRDQVSGPCVSSTPRGLGIANPYGSVPSNATAVALNVTVVTPSGDGFFTVWPAGESQPLASNLNFVAGQIVPNMVTVKLVGGGIEMAANNGCPHVVVDVAGYYEGGGANGPGGFTGITPVRALDTRNTGPCVSSTPRNLTLRPGLVPAGASAVALNVTVVGPSGDGFLTVWPAGLTRPHASNLNFVTGQTVPNMVTVKLSEPGGTISLFANNGCPHVVVDVAGYYTSPT